MNFDDHTSYDEKAICMLNLTRLIKNAWKNYLARHFPPKGYKNTETVFP